MGRVSKVLVTGGAGFIGSHLVRKLLRRSYEVIVIDNFKSGSIENIRGYLKNEGFSLVRGDVRDRAIVKDAVSKADAVVHLAALIDVQESVDDPLETHDVNVNGTLNLLNEAAKRGVRKFLFASSTAVYGEENLLPLREDYPPKPISPYAASKAGAEHYCQTFNRSYGFPTVILRLFNVYGSSQEHNAYSGVITTFLRNSLDDKPLVIHGNGEQTRDFIYIEDVVNAILLALENDGSVGEVLNVCTGKPTSVNELVQVLSEITGRNLQAKHDAFRKGDIRNNYGDPTKAQKILEFKAKFSLKEGIAQTITNMSKFTFDPRTMTK